MTTAIWWIRRDLRLTDNRALDAAVRHAPTVVPLFILDGQLLASGYMSPRRTNFLFSGLEVLHQALQAIGSRLIIRRGPPARALSELLDELRSGNAGDNVHVFAERDVSPYARQRDAGLAETLPITFVEGPGILPVDSVRKPDGSAYTVYTPYRRRWQEIATAQPPAVIPPPYLLSTPAHIASEALPIVTPRKDMAATADVEGAFPPGEAEAVARLERFISGKDAPINRYADDRNRPDLAGTSQLSPYLRFGMLSPRHAYAAARTVQEQASTPSARQGIETWISELIWREFYLSILANFPHVRSASFRPEYDRIRWINDPAQFDAWCAGMTGYPLVDAAMRQLQATGWMHNRVRMVVASFLVKDLLIDWRWGERWFMQHLVDGDPAANNGGWQWAAGTGTDAAPYFRIFNPVMQSAKFDPDGAYIRRWLPELAGVPLKHIHAPWEMSAADQVRSGCRIGSDYPRPMVDHHAVRERTLAAYKAALG